MLARIVTRRRLVILLGVLVILRAGLPEVVRRVLVRQLSQRLQTRVDIGDVDLSLLRGGVALKDVAIHSPTPQAPGEPPLVSWKRFGVQLRYVPLLWHAAQLRVVALDEPRIALDRLAGGELNLQALVPPSEPAAPAEAPAETPRRWKIGIDRLLLRSGSVRFRDLTLPEGAPPLEIAIPDIAVNDVALQPGLYGEPGRVRFQVKAEGGAGRVDSQLWPLDQGFALATRVKAFEVPLRRARLYIPGVGWSELAGELDAVVDHALAPDGRNVASGMVRLRDVAIRVPELGQAAFGVRRFAVRFAPVDLAARRATLTAVDVGGASVVVDLHGGDVLPLLRREARADAPVRAPAEDAAAASPSPPWHWAVNDLHVTGSKVSLLQEGAPLDIGVDVALRHLSDDGAPGRVEATLTVPPGSVAVAGALRATPPGFGGTVRIEQLPLHDLLRAAHAAANLPPALVKAATLGADLALEAGVTADGGAPAAPDVLAVKGTVGLDGMQAAGEDPNEFAVSWTRFVVPIEQASIPGVVPGAAPTGSPMRVALGAVRLEEPSVQLTRGPAGIVLPPPLGGRQGGTPAAATPVSSPPEEQPPRAVDATIGSFVLTHGRVGFTDQTVKPFFSGEIKPLEVDARGIRAQGPVVERFTVSATTPQKGKLDVAGSFRPEGGRIRVNGKDVALAPYNPYVASFTPYSLGRASKLSVKTDVTLGKGKYDSNTALTLHQLTVKGASGDTLFKQHFGIPLSMALALLRDLEGNIKLDIPVGVDQSGTTIGLGTVVAGALKSAILGAVTSPLKGIGAVLGTGDREGTIEPPPIKAEVGRPVVSAEGQKQIGQLAEFLAGRPGVGVALDPVVTPADVRWLREQDVRADIASRTGVVNALKGLPGRGGRNRVLKALAVRAEGKKGDLDDDDRELLDRWVAERPEISPDRIRALAKGRADAVVTALRDEHGIGGDRVSVSESAAKAEPREGEPSVAIEFGAPGD